MQKAVLWAASLDGMVFFLTVLVMALAVGLAGFVSAYYRGRAAAARKFSEMEKKIDYLERALWSLTDAEVKPTRLEHHIRGDGHPVGRAVVFHEKPGAPARVVTFEGSEAPFVGGYRTAPLRPEPPAPPKTFSWGKAIGQAFALTAGAAGVACWKTGQIPPAGAVVLGIGGAVLAAWVVVFVARRT